MISHFCRNKKHYSWTYISMSMSSLN
uniref:Uncharacterized protein n=1 Tax=Arundo donax TaxID=35708 RepID=A0A0A9FNB6_ARUDO